MKEKRFNRKSQTRQDLGRKVPQGQSVSQTHLIIFHGLRLLLGGVFLFACYDKILHPRAFAEMVFNYQILPDGLINIVALILPWLELLLGLCLISGVWLPGATVISTFLITIFIGALVFNQIRGLNIQCGCFSTEITRESADLWTVARDLSFFAGSAYLSLFVFSSRLTVSKSLDQ